MGRQGQYHHKRMPPKKYTSRTCCRCKASKKATAKNVESPRVTYTWAALGAAGSAVGIGGGGAMPAHSHLTKACIGRPQPEYNGFIAAPQTWGRQRRLARARRLGAACAQAKRRAQRLVKGKRPGAHRTPLGAGAQMGRRPA